MKGRIPMNRILGMVALVLLGASASAAETPPPKGPRISVEPLAFNFGDVLPSKTVDKEFIVKNFGSEDLTIAQIVPSCGCTVVDPNFQRVVKPGASTTFRLRLRTPGTAGHVVKSVVVKSNDPSKPSLEVKLEATVVAEPR
jgi:hypothetical protein